VTIVTLSKRRRVAESRWTSHNGRVPSWGSFSYAFGPVVAIVVLGLLVVILRWGFSRGGSVVAVPPKPGTPLDYGLLVPVAEAASEQDGRAMVSRLRAAGIVAGLADTTEGRRVMVWPDDAECAEQVLDRPQA
jgi:hypothetical protein